jgi:hypothetical protein
LSQKFVIILGVKDHGNNPIRGRFNAKYKAQQLYGKNVELIEEKAGPETDELSYKFVRKDNTKEETS